jgi:putative SOS response-associated peptidase YedK
MEGDAGDVGGKAQLFAFLTTEVNDLAQPVPAAALPPVLTEPDWDKWLEAPPEIALELQGRTHGPPHLAIVARGAAGRWTGGLTPHHR